MNMSNSFAKTFPDLPEVQPGARLSNIVELLLTRTAPSIENRRTTEVTIKMLSRTAARLPNTVGRRGFHTTRPQLASPYHYPEGPRSNIPFNPMTRFFFLRYWGSMAFFFGAPFGIAVWQTKKNQ